MTKPKLVILTGPQGSGNHMWSKIFALHDEVIGWKALLDEEWIGHKDEPFNEFWQDPSLLKDHVWDGNWYVTSISCPYQIDGKLIIPDYKAFTKEAKKYFDIQFVVLGRDNNIMAHQNRRIRGVVTYDFMLSQTYWMIGNYPVYFASMELLYLYTDHYLQQMSLHLDFPIAWRHPGMDAIVRDNANEKYIKAAGAGKYDKQARKVSGL